jgi:hypothetical protein
MVFGQKLVYQLGKCEILIMAIAPHANVQVTSNERADGCDPVF